MTAERGGAQHLRNQKAAHRGGAQPAGTSAGAEGVNATVRTVLAPQMTWQAPDRIVVLRRPLVLRSPPALLRLCGRVGCGSGSPDRYVPSAYCRTRPTPRRDPWVRYLIQDVGARRRIRGDSAHNELDKDVNKEIAAELAERGIARVLMPSPFQR